MKIAKKLFPYLNPYIKRFIQAGICMGCVALLTTMLVWLIRTVVDGVLIAKDINKLFLIAACVPIIYLFKGVFTYLQNYLMNYISQSIVRDIRLKLYVHLQNLSVDFFHKNATGQLMSRLTHDTTILQNSIGQVPVQIIRDGLTLFFLLGTIFYLHWKFALFTLFLFPVAAIPVAILGKKMRNSGKQIQVRMADLFMAIQEGITGNVITKIFCKEKDEIKRFEKENQRYYSETMRWVRADVLGSPIMEFLGSIAAVFLLWFGGKDVIHGVWTTGSFFSFLGASISAYKPVKEFTNVNSRIQQGLACAERVFEILEEKATVQEATYPIEFTEFKNEIIYNHVDFSYDNQIPILKNIHVQIKKGEILAIVGPSGSGKTTFTQLLPRLFDCVQGSIQIDQTDIKLLSFESLRKQIGMVTQENILFNETVKYNLLYGKGSNAENTEMSEIETAAKIANAHDFIQELPQGYNTIIGERGIKLSGGQRQRLSIARAVLKNPPILILDEATSALDNESEKLVQQALERLMEHRTVLVIAHRLSTIRKAHRIIVINEGTIVEEGTHSSLLQKSGLYKKLYETEIQLHP